MIELLEEAARNAREHGPLAEGQAYATLGSAYLRVGQLREALNTLGRARDIAERIHESVAPVGPRIQFGDVIRQVVRDWVSAAFAIIETSFEPETDYPLINRLAASLEDISNGELTSCLLETYLPKRTAPLGGKDIEGVLTRFENIATKKAHLIYLYTDSRGTHLIRFTGSDISIARDPLPTTDKEWQSLWRDMADTYDPISSIGNPARPQDWTRDSSFPETWKDLGGALAEFVSQQVNRNDHIFLSLDPTLDRLPIVAAPLGEEVLIDHCTVSIVPSGLSLIAMSTQQKARPKEYVCFGTGTERDFLTRRFSESALAIYHQIGDHLQAQGAVSGCDNLKWETASKEAWEQRLAATNRAFITCHGAFSHELGFQSGLLLPTAGELPKSNVPTLTAGEVMEMSLGTDFIGINACVIGLSRVRGIGEEIGLSRALYQSGVRTHVAPIWPVYLRAGNHFMCSMVAARAAGAKSYADAFRTAMLATRERYPQQYHWAPFTLRGSAVSTLNK